MTTKAKTAKKPRVLISKVGLDSHDMGPKMLCRGLRDAGVEVIYLGLRCTPEEILHAAVQEDVDVIGISSYCGGHLLAGKQMVKLMKDQKVKGKKVIFGGVIPMEDAKTLKELGVDEVFLPSQVIAEVADYVKSVAK